MMNAIMQILFPELVSRPWESPHDIVVDSSAFQAMQQKLKLRRYPKKDSDPYHSKDHLAAELKYNYSPFEWLYDSEQREEAAGEMRRKRPRQGEDAADMLELYLRITGYQKPAMGEG